MVTPQTSFMATQVNTSLQGLMSKWGLDRGDAWRLRHVLVGDSVVDWRGLHIDTHEAVDKLLRLNKIDLANEKDASYLKQVHQHAVEFLDQSMGQQVSAEVANPEDVRDLFLIASGPMHVGTQQEACMLLKVMNIVHHLNARDLQFRAPVSERDLAFMAHQNISDAVSQMRDQGMPIVDFKGGTKAPDSLLLKLLAKRDSLAAQVYDKVRYRLIVESPADIVRTITYLFREVVPFNYVIPGQSRNDLIPVPDADETDQPEPDDDPYPEFFNEFSGPTYKQLNFIVDLPLRLDDFVCTLGPEFDDLGNVMFQMVEFQIADRLTAEANETGENRHDLYKARQRQRVMRRLKRHFGGKS